MLILLLRLLTLLTGGLHHQTGDRSAAQATIPSDQTEVFVLVLVYDTTAAESQRHLPAPVRRIGPSGRQTTEDTAVRLYQSVRVLS